MDWSKVAGFGVAGNFTGHLEQAGESPDFVHVKVQDTTAPKGVFPFYLPNLKDHPLSRNPYSSDEIQLLNLHENHQIEPEVSILFRVTYQNGSVVALHPIQAMAHNDCSIRRKGATKISEKKNWGACSKGVSNVSIPLTGLSEGDNLDEYVLGCYLIRDGVLHMYGLTSPVREYSYFHETLLDWLVSKFNTQQDYGPLENLAELLAYSKYPTHLCISIGATRYTSYGERTFLQPNDTACVVLYNPQEYTTAQIEHQLLFADSNLSNAAILKQNVTFKPSEP
jgi:hypothetical protein